MKSKAYLQKNGYPCVYKLFNKVTSHCYVGSTVGHTQRKGKLYYKLRNGTCDNDRLQNAWNKYREENFEFIVLEFIYSYDLELRFSKEQYWIDSLQATNTHFGYNKAPRAGTNLGTIRTPEARLKMSIAKTGTKQSPEVIEKRVCKSRRAVLVFDKFDNFIIEFDSVKNAGKTLNINSTSISKVLSKCIKTAGGYKFKYKNEALYSNV